MFVIRRAKVEDASTLLKLARMVHFINLPAAQDIIMEKVLHSRGSFIRAAGGDAPLPRRHPADKGLGGLQSALHESDLFMFALEDTDTGACLGTSQVLSHMGGPGSPNVSFKLSERSFYSETLQTGTTQTVAKLHLDESGPSELGGLILQPSFRRHKQRLGRLLSLIRFHFVGLHRHAFADEMIAEMMAPISPDGQNLLWEQLGRRFISLSYTEADRFCQVSREFITSLLPHEEIYLTLLSPEARAVIGQVGNETVPARIMLERLGFEYRGFVDPFDGGPHLHARTDDITIVRDSSWKKLGDPVTAAQCDTHAIVSTLDIDGEFRAIQCPMKQGTRIGLQRTSMRLLGVEPGQRIGVTPLDAPAPKKKTTKRTRKAKA